MNRKFVNQLVADGLPQVLMIARMMKRRTPRADFDSLYSNGELALWQAAQRWQDDHAGNPGFPRFAAVCEKRAMVDGMRKWFGRKFFRYDTTSLDIPMPSGGTRGDQISDRRANVEQAAEDRARIKEWVDASKEARAQMVRETRPPRPLTEIEIEILQAAADGESAPETATRLHKSLETVKGQRGIVIRKLDARGITNAVRQAMRLGIIT